MQGCNLSTTFFNIYIDKLLEKIREENIGGIKIVGIFMQMLNFVDDIAMVVENKEDLNAKNNEWHIQRILQK